MKNTASRCRGYFYPRSPCGERRLSYFYIIKITQFLSTLSLRRATLEDLWCTGRSRISIHALLAESDPTRWAPTCRISNFYPRSPCGERRSLSGNTGQAPAISIHALLAESDTTSAGKSAFRRHFYPRSPCGERLHQYIAYVVHHLFLSTLSLRRATAVIYIVLQRFLDFYPRSPCGERPPITFRHCTTYLFLSTLSLRRATLSD